MKHLLLIASYSKAEGWEANLKFTTLNRCHLSSEETLSFKNTPAPYNTFSLCLLLSTTRLEDSVGSTLCSLYYGNNRSTEMCSEMLICPPHPTLGLA